MVWLEKVTADNYRECLKLKVAEDQEHFVTSNDISLARAVASYDKVTPFAIYNDDIMVGFIMLRFNEGYNNYLIWQLMIDERYQSKGYGKQAMKLAIEWMKNEDRCYEIVLTCKDGNHLAEKMYTKLGFEKMSEVVDGEVDMVLRL
ncbi:GNAT family N-acetyltransferase [Oceanirhabdus seepicola]|uniref:GNAT family N-acetyltransferase n=1 Tax=Oceanirhabdus seepicola TaxID=2828781 RepID=A0A9J6P0F9_9CLOT|nr:GNAT family N-acetyltransferase [Oceanirhabdus seepicola]MCM1988920.1 GNAT family N-acetyltransferase [Oceanirhabdus seepicola]